MEALGNKNCKVENNTEDQKKCSRVKIKKNLTWFTKTGYFPRQLTAKIACMNMDAATKINREFNQKKDQQRNYKFLSFILLSRRRSQSHRTSIS